MLQDFFKPYDDTAFGCLLFWLLLCILGWIIRFIVWLFSRKKNSVESEEMEREELLQWIEKQSGKDKE